MVQGAEGEFTVVHNNILGVDHLEEDIAAIVFPANIINAAAGNGDIETGADRSGRTGTIVDFASGQADIFALVSGQTDDTASVQA